MQTGIKKITPFLRLDGQNAIFMGRGPLPDPQPI
jgi:hypothetical protein